MAKSYIPFNGFKSQEEYQNTFDTLKKGVEDSDIYDRDYFSVHFDKCIECIVGEYKFNIWDNYVEIEILNEKLHIVDRGITEIVHTILGMLDCELFNDLWE